jgi:hypothetical protein
MKSVGKLVLSAFVTIPGVLAAYTPAQALDFSFSFGNTSGPISGTVAGRVIGLVDNTTGSASQVVIDSFPAGLEGTPNNGLIATNWSGQVENSFTVTSGNITSGVFAALEEGGNDTLCINSSSCGSPSTLLTFDGFESFVGSNSPATFTPLASTPVPFEFNSTLGLLIAGAFWGGKKLKDKVALKKLKSN